MDFQLRCDISNVWQLSEVTMRTRMVQFQRARWKILCLVKSLRPLEEDLVPD